MELKTKENLKYRLNKAIFENKYLLPGDERYKKNETTIEIYSTILNHCK